MSQPMTSEEIRAAHAAWKSFPAIRHSGLFRLQIDSRMVDLCKAHVSGGTKSRRIFGIVAGIAAILLALAAQSAVPFFIGLVLCFFLMMTVTTSSKNDILDSAEKNFDLFSYLIGRKLLILEQLPPPPGPPTAWTCPECAVLNLGKVRRCLGCECESPLPPPMASHRSYPPPSWSWRCGVCGTANDSAVGGTCPSCKSVRGTWRCPDCAFDNFPTRDTCGNCKRYRQGA
jgi:hypothetical protein